MLQYLVAALALGSIYVLFTLGLSTIWGVFDVLNLAYGAIFTLGAYAAYSVSTAWHAPLAVVILVAIAVGAIASVAVDLLIFQPIRRRRSLTREQAELASLIASIGLGTAAVALVQRWTAGVPVHISQDVYQTHTYTWGAVTVNTLQIAVFIIAIAISAVLGLSLQRTKWGRSVRSVASDAETSQLFGISPRLVAVSVTALSGAVAGLAGVLLALYQSSITANMGDGLLLKAFAVIVIGAVGSISGSVIGGFGLAIAETLVVAYGPASYRDAISFVVILAVLLIRPTGLMRARYAGRV